MCPSIESPVFMHARTALGRARSDVLAALPRISPTDAQPLELQLASLEQRLADLEAATEAQLPLLWSHFFVCYDRLLVSLRACDQRSADG